jgi:hypothetical protein
MRKLLPILLASSLLLTGCDKDKSVATTVLENACPHFPGTVIYSLDKRILWVQTDVNGVSPDVAESIFKQACLQATKNFGPIKVNIQTELSFASKQLLIVGFRNMWVVWPVSRGLDAQGVPKDYKIVDEPTLTKWLQSKLGYPITPDRVSVITLEDAKNAPKGEPIATHTLAEYQVAAKAKQQQEINDYILKQKVDSTP